MYGDVSVRIFGATITLSGKYCNEVQRFYCFIPISRSVSLVTSVCVHENCDIYGTYILNYFQTYTGFFKCNVEEYLVEAKRLFKWMGFVYDPDKCTLSLLSKDAQAVEDVAVDLLIAQEETGVIQKLKSYCENTKSIGIQDVLTAREQVEDLTEDWVDTLSFIAEITCDRNNKRSQSHVETQRTDPSRRLPISHEEDWFRSHPVKSPIRSHFVGSPPNNILTTQEFEDMVSNLPPPLTHMSNSFKQKHAKAEHVPPSPIGIDQAEEDADTDLHHLEEELYLSCNDKEIADLRSMMWRSQTYDGNQSVDSYQDTTIFAVNQSNSDEHYSVPYVAHTTPRSAAASNEHAFHLEKRSVNTETLPDAVNQNKHIYLDPAQPRIDNNEVISSQLPSDRDSEPRSGSFPHPVDGQRSNNTASKPVPAPRLAKKMDNKRLPEAESDKIEVGNSDVENSQQNSGPQRGLFLCPDDEQRRHPYNNTVDQPLPTHRQSKKVDNKRLPVADSDQVAEVGTTDVENCQQNWDHDDMVVVSLKNGKTTQRVEGSVNCVQTAEPYSSSQDTDKSKRVASEHYSSEGTRTGDDRKLERCVEDAASPECKRHTQMAGIDHKEQCNVRKVPGLAIRVLDCEWECDHCRRKNVSAVTACNTCCKIRGVKDDSSPMEGQGCTFCTFQNPKGAIRCNACEHSVELRNLGRLLAKESLV